jgi:hypothetical protein
MEEIMSSTIEVTPSEITKAVQRGRVYPETLTVRSTGTAWAGYQVQKERPYTKWADTTPDNFALEPGESITVELVLKVPVDAKTGDHTFSVQIANEQAPDDVTNVPITLKVPIQPWLKYLVIVAIILLVLVVLYLIVRPPV